MGNSALSFRARVTLGAGLVALVTATIIAFVTSAAAERGVQQAIEAAPNRLLDDVVTQINEGNDPASIQLTTDESGSIIFISHDGAVINSSAGLGRPRPVRRDPPSRGLPAEVLSENFQNVKRIVPYNGEQYRLDAWAPSLFLNQSLETGQFLAWTASLVAALLATAGVWFATGIALQPVKRMSEQAASIRPNELTRRVDVPDTSDELAQLGLTVNQMLQRFETGVTRQRQFVSDASHELRSPITAIATNAELGLFGSPEEMKVALEVAHRNSLRLAALVDDLLTLSLTDEALLQRSEPILLHQVLAEEVEKLGPEVAVAIAANERAVLVGDARRIRWLISNLLANAVTHTVATVEASCVVVDRDVRISIDDDGPGVPFDQRSVIFDRFARTDHSRSRSKGGAGIGLSIVAAVANAHGGSVSVQTSHLGGARFVVSLPLDRSLERTRAGAVIDLDSASSSATSLPAADASVGVEPAP